MEKSQVEGGPSVDAQRLSDGLQKKFHSSPSCCNWGNTSILTNAVSRDGRVGKCFPPSEVWLNLILLPPSTRRLLPFGWFPGANLLLRETERHPPHTRTVSHPHCALQIPFSLLLEPLLGRDVFPSWPGDLRDTFFWHKRMSWMEGMYLFPEPQADPTNLPLALYVVFY